MSELLPASPYTGVGPTDWTTWLADGTWQRIELSRVKSTAENIQRIQIQCGDENVTFYVDDAARFASGAPEGVPYRDGDSPGWVWDGEPGASTSRGWVFVP